MNVVVSSVNTQYFLPFVLHNAGNVFIQFFFPGRKNECFTVLNCKNGLDINLGIRVGHILKFLWCDLVFNPGGDYMFIETRMPEKCATPAGVVPLARISISINI
jgi:hypothetical protein